MRTLFSRCALLTIAVLLLAGLAVGQATQTYGRLEGTVKDQSGGVIPGVTVTLSSPTGTKTLVTGDNGEFTFPFLNPGKYDLKAELEAFKSYEQKGIEVRLGSTMTLAILLTPGEISDVVTVTGEAPLVDTTTTTIGANITSGLYASLPVQRNFTALVGMAPGVGSGGTTGAANPSIGGGSGLENNYVVDGVNITNPGYGGTGTYSAVYGSLGTGVNFDMVKEVQVKSGGFEAEYGQSTGGVVNVITKSGGNEFHGGLYFYMQPQGWQAKPRYSDTYRQSKNGLPLGTDNKDVAFDLNGYLKKDRIFFYMGFNPQWNTLSQQAPSTSPQWLNGDTEVAGYYRQEDKIYSWSGKLTLQPHSNHNFEFSTTADPSQRSDGPNRRFTSDNDNDYSHIIYGSWNFIGRYNGVLSKNWFLTASLGRAYNRFSEAAVHPDYISFADWTQLPVRPTRGGLGFFQNAESKNWQFNFKTSYHFNAGGEHNFDIGYAMEKIHYIAYRGYTGPDVVVPAYTLASGYSFPGGTILGTAGRLRPRLDWGPNPYYQETRGNENPPGVDTTTTYHSFYLQDAWKIGKHITFKPGIRWDYQRMDGAGAGSIGYTFTGNWGPRFGLIYDVAGNGKTKIYGSWGRFFEKVPNDICVRSFSQEVGLLSLWYACTIDANGVLTLGTFQNPIRGLTVGVTGGVTEVGAGTHTMYQNEFVMGFDHQIRPDLSVGARYIWRTLGRCLEDLGSVTLDQDAVGVPQNFVVGNPGFTSDVFNNTTGAIGADGVPDGFPDATRSYNAFELTLDKRFSNGFQFLANYRLAKLWGNYEGFFRNDNGQNDPNISSLFDYRWNGTRTDPLYWQFQPGYLNTDRRHTINFNGAYTTPWKMTIGLGSRLTSGPPLSGFLAHPAYLNAGELPDGPRGNYGRGDWINNVDLHFDYPFTFGDKYKLRFALDLFNVFNRQQVALVDQNIEIGSPGAGLPPVANVDFLTPLQFQQQFTGRLAIRFEF